VNVVAAIAVAILIANATLTITMITPPLPGG